MVKVRMGFSDTAIRSIDDASSPTFKIAGMAVTGVQFYSQFFLRHAVGLAQVLDTFAGGVRIKVHKPALRPQSSAANRRTTGPGNR